MLLKEKLQELSELFQQDVVTLNEYQKMRETILSNWTKIQPSNSSNPISPSMKSLSPITKNNFDKEMVEQLAQDNDVLVIDTPYQFNHFLNSNLSQQTQESRDVSVDSLNSTTDSQNKSTTEINQLKEDAFIDEQIENNIQESPLSAENFLDITNETVFFSYFLGIQIPNGDFYPEKQSAIENI
jgi:hypothetical protein